MNNTRLEKLKEMQRQKPDDVFLKYAIALEYVSMNEDAEAQKIFELLLEKFSDYIATYYHLGKLYERSGEEEKAKAVYTKGIELAERNNDAKNLRELNEALNF